jgi:hypothetical protein
MLSSKLVISIVAVVVVSVVVIGGVVLIRPCDRTVAPSAQSVAPPTTTDFPAGKLIHSTPKGY